MLEKLDSVDCLPRSFKIVQVFHADLKDVVQFGYSYSEAFDICNGVKQVCVLATNLFSIIFVAMLKRAFGA